MIYILFIIILIFLIIAYQTSSFGLISPWIIIICSFAFSILVALINAPRWGLALHPKTVVVVAIGLFAFGVGQGIVDYTYGTRKRIQFPKDTQKSIVIIPKSSQILMMIVIIISMLMQYQHIENVIGYRITKLTELSQGILRYRMITINPEGVYESSFIFNIFLIFSQSIIYVYLYFVVYNIIFFKQSIPITLYFIISVYTIQILLSGSRTPLMRIVIYILVLIVYFLSKKVGFSKKNIFKILKIVIFIIIIFLIFFYLSGYFTQKTEELTLINTLSIYIGSPIFALDYFLANIEKINDLFGKETLNGVYNILRSLGLNIPKYKYQLDSVTLNILKTNIYSSFRRYVSDYSYLGLLIIQLFQGFLYTLVLCNISRKKKYSFLEFSYASLIFPLIESAWEERFFNILFTARTVYFLVFSFLIFKFFLIGKKKNIHF